VKPAPAWQPAMKPVVKLVMKLVMNIAAAAQHINFCLREWRRLHCLHA
jgi:hypothetical protein